MPPEVSRALGQLAQFTVRFQCQPPFSHKSPSEPVSQFGESVVHVYESLGADTDRLLQMTDAEVYAETRKRVWDYPDKELVQTIFDGFIQSDYATAEAMEVFALQR